MGPRPPRLVAPAQILEKKWWNRKLNFLLELLSCTYCAWYKEAHDIDSYFDRICVQRTNYDSPALLILNGSELVD